MVTIANSLSYILCYNKKKSNQKIPRKIVLQGGCGQVLFVPKSSSKIRNKKNMNTLMRMSVVVLVRASEKSGGKESGCSG